MSAREVFLRLNYAPERVAKYGHTLCYRKEIQTKKGTFEVRVVPTTQDLDQLPYVELLAVPKDLEGRLLPHVASSGKLCIVDETTIVWDPNDPAATIALVDCRIQSTVAEIVAGNFYAGFMGEFINYWAGYPCYLLEELEELESFGCHVAKQGRYGQIGKEYVVASGNQLIEKWRTLREISATDVVSGGSALVVRIAGNNWLPRMDWPPATVADIAKWLATTDPSALDKLCRGLVKRIQKGGSKVIVIIDIPDEGQIGFEVGYTGKGIDLIKRQRVNVKLKSILPLVQSRQHIRAFRRLKMYPCSQKFVVGRNRPAAEDLRGLNVAVIGIGTIGGFVTELLVKIGAGQPDSNGQRGSLALFDPEDLRPENLGRHCLGAKYLGWNKAEAMAERLIEVALHGIAVCTHNNFSVSAEKPSDYDVVVDVSGHEPLSRAIALWKRKEPISKLLLVHGWNDAYGRMARVLIDKGEICYGCLGNLGERPRLQLVKDKSSPVQPFTRSCGSSFIAHDASLSAIAAGLVQQATLAGLAAERSWNYVQHGMDRKVVHHDRKQLTALKSCSVCQVLGRMT